MSMCSRVTVLWACLIPILMSVTAPAGRATPFRDFDDGTLQGWTKLEPFHGELENPGHGGNPGGFLFCRDTMAGGGGLYAQAPEDFTGDLTAYRGLRWDEYLYDCSPDPTYPTYPAIYAVIGADTTIYRERDPSVGSLEQWRARYVPFDASAWELVRGSASFDDALRHVARLVVSMDCNTQCNSEAGIDNILLVAPDPERSTVDPWDAYGHAFVSPGTQSGVDLLTVTVLDLSGAPLPDASVEVRFFGCDLLCLDYPDVGLDGTTNANGSITVDPRVGGCDDCTIQVSADGVVLRTYTRIVSTDWNGYHADGVVTAMDLAWLQSAIQQNLPCGDYDGDGTAGVSDLQMFLTAYGAMDSNSSACYPWPPVGACCLPSGSCTMTTQAGCVSPGVWHGDWHACVPNPCPEPLGACCAPDGACTLVGHADCLPPNVWFGETSTCDPNPCPVLPLGVCCTYTGNCSLVTEVECPPPAVWRGDVLSCDPNPCPDASDPGIMYSIDRDAGQLVSVRLSDGAVSVLTDLERSFQDADLAASSDRIYVLNSNTNPTLVEIVTIGRANYQTYSTHPVTFESGPVTGAEGLACVDGTLYASFRTGTCVSCSNAIGILSEAGVLTGACDYRGFDAMADCDGLAAKAGGGFLWMDANPPAQDDLRLVNVAYLPEPAYNVIQQFHPYIAINDVAFTPAGDLWGIDNQTRLLYQFDPTTGDILRMFPYQSTGDLMGLEYFSGNVTDVAPGSVATRGPLSVIPNPAQGHVEFRWPGGSMRREISVFDSSGRLQWRKEISGDPPVAWDATDEAGRPVPQGVYLVRGRVGSRVAAQRFVILR